MWWLWLTLALAQPAEGEETAASEGEESPPDAEIIIYGDRIKEARVALHETLIGLGYTPKRSRNGRTLYMPPWEKRWKPRVILDDDGWYKTRSPQFVYQGIDLGLQPEPFEDIPGTVTNAGIRIGVRFWIVSGRKLVWQEMFLAEALEPNLRELRAAIAAEAHTERMNLLPEELDAIWFDATVSHAQRRKRLAEELWMCAPTPEGEARWSAILVYLSEMVQTSAHPYPEAEWDVLIASPPDPEAQIR